MKTSKRLLTLLLALVMLVGVFTIGASAEDLIVPVATKITISYNTSSVSELGTILPHTLEEDGSFTLPGKDIEGLCWSLGNDVFEAGESFTYENMMKIAEGKTSFTFVAFIDEPISDEDPVYGYDKEDPKEEFKPGHKPSWKPDWDYDYPTYGKEYDLFVGVYVVNNSWDYKYDCNHKYNCSCDKYYNKYFDCNHKYNCDCDSIWFTDSWWFDSSWDDCELTKGWYFDSDADYYGEFHAGEKVRISAPSPKTSYGVKYQFVGWRNDSFNSKNGYFADKNDKTTTYTMPAADATIYAVYEVCSGGSYYGNCNSRHNHTITYTDGVKGETVFRDVVKTVRHNASTPTIKNPTRKGYIFAGWSPKVATKATECVTYEAKWISEDAPSLTTEHVAYLKGYGKGYVRPEATITRAEFATMLYRLMDAKSTKEYYASSNTFTDVSSGDWYNDAISTLANAGVIKIANGESYKPNKAITRAEVVAMLTAFYQTGKEYSCKFNDVPANHAYYDEIAQAVSMGWIKGYGGNTFMPDATITRAEVAAIMNRVLDRNDCNTKDTKNFVDNSTSAWYYQDIVEASIAH